MVKKILNSSLQTLAQTTTLLRALRLHTNWYKKIIFFLWLPIYLMIHVFSDFIRTLLFSSNNCFGSFEIFFDFDFDFVYFWENSKRNRRDKKWLKDYFDFEWKKLCSIKKLVFLDWSLLYIFKISKRMDPLNNSRN
jgi:hypothetical protein